MKSVTLADVAAAAGVSVATVSLVLSGKAGSRSSEETARRVRSVAKRLGYRANRLAKGLKESQTRTLGILSIDVATTPYAGEMLRAAQRTARARDYDLLFIEVENNPASIGKAFDLLREHQVAGAIVATYFHAPVDLPRSAPTNLVFANCFPTTGSYFSFVPAEYESFMSSLKIVGLAGHKNVSLILHDCADPAVAPRKKAFLDAALDFGWNRAPERVFLVEAGEPLYGYRATLEMVVRDPSITAIACFNDPLAMGVYQALNELGLAVPGDVSVVGFDDLLLISEGLRPGLTTVGLPHYEMGREAAEKLIQLCEGKDEPPEMVQIRGALAIRESIAVPRTAGLPAPRTAPPIEREK
jgi:LacI family transcriptional regulator